MLWLLVILIGACNSASLPPIPPETGPNAVVTHPGEPAAEPILGQIRLISDAYGKYQCYLPSTLTSGSDILVLVHGTPDEQEKADTTARYYVENWIEFSEEHDLILIAPAFDQINFSSKDGQQALGGYRSLFGRHVGADQFMLNIVQDVQHRYGLTGGRFYLYGHSAGGQFVARFIVTHPEHVKGAVITAAAIYPQPDPDIAWPYGLGPLDTTLVWHNPEVATPVTITPNRATWLEATTLPVTVIVGLNDLEHQPDRTGQKGNNRVVIARNWVRDMNAFAAEHGVESRLRLWLIPKLGHSSYGLLPHSQAALSSSL